MGLVDRFIPHPFRRGLVAARDDIDSLADMLNGVKGEIDSLKNCEFALRAALANFIEGGERKTQRVVGEKYICKLVWPDDHWNQATLKELVAEDPQQAKVYIRVDRYAPNLKEVRKMEEAWGNEQFTRFKEKMLSARQPSSGPPSVTVGIKEQ